MAGFLTFNAPTGIKWLDQLQQASWRGVPFHMDTSEIVAGNNTVLREYPFQDLPTVFSMGKAAEQIKLSAYVIGDDYQDKLAALRDVLEGEGILVHPTQGSIRCYQHGTYTIKENPTFEGGVARLDLIFIRAEERRYPVGKQNSTDKMIEDIEAARQSIFDGFTENFDIEGLPGWSLEEISEGLSDAFQAVWDVMGPIQGSMTYYDNLIQQFLSNPANELYNIVDNITGMVGSIMNVPKYLDSLVAISFFGALRDLWKNPPTVNIASAYKTSGISSTSSATVSTKPPAESLVATESPYQTETRQKTEDAMNELADLFEGCATISAAEAVAGIELDNYEESVALREDFHQQFTMLLKRGVGDHTAMLRAHTSVINDLRDRSKDLSRVMTYTPETFMPVVYISYQHFGTISYSEEIMNMNPHIHNPLLVPPGVPLRIIKRDN